MLAKHENLHAMLRELKRRHAHMIAWHDESFRVEFRMTLR